MKKTILACLCLILLALTSSALASDIDLTALSYDTLVALKLRVDAEVMSRPETKEVSVPVGTYEVGVHIPAGEYTLSALSDSNCFIYVYHGAVTTGGYGDENYILGRGETAGRVVLADGMHVVIDSGTCIFAPFTGLGF